MKRRNFLKSIGGAAAGIALAPVAAKISAESAPAHIAPDYSWWRRSAKSEAVDMTVSLREIMEKTLKARQSEAAALINNYNSLLAKLECKQWHRTLPSHRYS